jgi:hypothetical protein
MERVRLDGHSLEIQLVEISDATVDLGDCPVTNPSAQRRHIHWWKN